MTIVNIVFWAVAILTALLLVRLVFDYVKLFVKTGEPTGFVLVVHDTAYGATSPVLGFIRKGVPHIKIGRVVRMDVAFLVLLLVCSLMLNLLNNYR